MSAGWGRTSSSRSWRDTAEQVRAAVGNAGTDLMFPPFVSFAALGFALVLSVFKPWGRTGWGRRPETAPARAPEKSRAGAAAMSEPLR